MDKYSLYINKLKILARFLITQLVNTAAPWGISMAGGKQMNTLQQRSIIYAALALLCAMVAPLSGVVAISWSFLQVVAVIEVTYWFGTRARQRSAGLSIK